MSMTQSRRDENDRHVADNVRRYGCHVYSVGASDDQSTPAFTYSIGLFESAGVPDVIVLGVRPSLGKAMVDAYQEFALEGTRFEPGERYAGFLGSGFEVYVEPLANGAVAGFMLGCFRYYRDRPFSAAQIVYPTVDGVWPWEPGASAWFVNAQPMLGRSRLDER